MAIAAATGNTVVEAGVVAPVDAVVASGMTSLGPERTFLFQDLAITSPPESCAGRSEGVFFIEVQPTVVSKKGEKIGEAAAQLINLLGNTFKYGMAAEAVAAGQAAPLQITDIGGNAHPLAAGWWSVPDADLVAMAMAQHPALGEAKQRFELVTHAATPATVPALLSGAVPTPGGARVARG